MYDKDNKKAKAGASAAKSTNSERGKDSISHKTVSSNAAWMAAASSKKKAKSEF
jgi:hypothetical protein